MAETTALTEKDVEARLIEAKATWEAEAKITNAAAIVEAVNTATAETLTTAKAEQEVAVADAINLAQIEGARASCNVVKEILARCDTAGVSLTAARDMIERNLTVEDAKDEVIDNLVKNAKPVGDAGGSDLGVKGKDPSDKFRKEFKAAGGEAKIGCTEDEYVASCLATEAGGFVG